MEHDNCTCGATLCECTCKECLTRNSARIEAEAKHERLADLVKRLDAAGINIEDLAELVWFARGQWIEKEIAKRIESGIRATFARLKVQVDWTE